MSYKIFTTCWVIILLAITAATGTDAPSDVGLVAYWNFDGSLSDKAGETEDNLTARGEGGIAAIARFVTPAQLPVVSGRAVALGVESGDAQYLTAPISQDLKLDSTYTIAMWIHPT
ncbi:MAG: hypothetical protein ACYSWW_04465, partial [Planctomycetota bacterium]